VDVFVGAERSFSESRVVSEGWKWQAGVDNVLFQSKGVCGRTHWVISINDEHLVALTGA
jgi:hypothetical protein